MFFLLEACLAIFWFCFGINFVIKSFKEEYAKHKSEPKVEYVTKEYYIYNKDGLLPKDYVLDRNEKYSIFDGREYYDDAWAIFDKYGYRLKRNSLVEDSLLVWVSYPNIEAPPTMSSVVLGTVFLAIMVVPIAILPIGLLIAECYNFFTTP